MKLINLIMKGVLQRKEIKKEAYRKDKEVIAQVMKWEKRMKLISTNLLNKAYAKNIISLNPI